MGLSDIEKLRMEGLEYYERLADQTKPAVQMRASDENEPLDLSGVFDLGVKGSLRPGD
jgi:hypothetical protein